ncbi:type IV pilin N-terminal domain-containing protein [Halobacteria archaeon HArc-curdl5-1]|uniref:Type IV pilin N-terminal domain-containing protein n=2 Tax=Halapricum hydrolyticum TaxID=2979991 RepID=A0AAE3ICK6_9EURY|nr:type IV pilin N-terminal domain-containing protein [Halapricum hydrolyticum]MCU4727732.1 type IV pilin N-terminal domain-containing protein [Halapricum hydrolyticum]
MTRSYTRRRALRIGSAGIVGCLAGCTGLLNGDDNDSENDDTTPSTEDGGNNGERPPELGVVPGSATAVAHVDAAALLDGPVGESAIEGALSSVATQQPSYDGPESYDAALDTIETEFGLDPQGISSVTAFVGDQSSEEIGIVAETDYDEPDVLDVLQADGSVSKETYGGVTIYTDPGDSAVGVLGDGQYAAGPVGVVESVIDVTNGEKDAAGGDVVTTYEDAPSGPIRFGAVVPDEGDRQSAGALAAVETVRGGMSADGDQRRLVVEMEATDTDAAGRLTTTLERGLSELQSRMEGESGPLADALAQLDAVDVQRDGATVSMVHSASAEEAGNLMAVAVAVVGTFVLDLGESQAATYPRASFAFDYDAGAETVTITHQSGDAIDGSNLYVRGTTGNGTINAQWAGDYGVSEVMAGSRVTVQNVTDSFELRVVRDPADQEQSAVLAAMSGPEA